MTEHQPKYYPGLEHKDRQPNTANRSFELAKNAVYLSSAVLHLDEAFQPKGMEVHFEHTPETFLEAMRTYVKMQARNKFTSIPTAHNPVCNQLLRIHQAVEQHKKTNYITATDIGRLGYNAHCFQEKINNPPSFTFSFLEKLYRTYTQDTELFHANGYVSAGLVALQHSPEIIKEVAQRCTDHPFIKSDISHVFRFHTRDPLGTLDKFIARGKELINDIEPKLREEYGFEGAWKPWIVRQIIKYSDHEDKAREFFSLMKQLHEKYPQAPIKKLEEWTTAYTLPIRNSKVISPKIDELLAHLPPSIAYSEQALVSAAEELHRLRGARRDGTLRKEGKLIKPSPYLTPESLQLAYDAEHNWHEVFNNINLLQEASALWTDVTLYNLRVAAQDPSLTIRTDSENLYYILISFARDVAVLRKQGRKDPAVYATKNGPNIHGNYIDFEKQAKILHPWLTPAIARLAFAHPHTKDVLASWDAKFKELTSLYPDHPDLPAYRCKLLATYEGDAREIAQTYLARVDEIVRNYEGEPFVKRVYALHWAQHKSGYQDEAKKHIVRVQEIDTLLRQKGSLYNDPVILGCLAFLHAQPDDITEFTAAQNVLEAFREDESHGLTRYMEQWMIDHIATVQSSESCMQHKLVILAQLKRNKEHLGHLLPHLTLLDRKATMTIFGFVQDITKAQLEQELDVPNLDDYVLKEILPTKLAP